jgi:NAD(P)-dependent dehydrogenase (short-subunit alcohol dehydrogenase family)
MAALSSLSLRSLAMTTQPQDTSSQAVRQQRDIQSQVAAADKAAGEEKSFGAMQAGARRYPEPPLPQQHQAKPGVEARLDPQPMYDAPFYKGSEKLKDRVAIITGGDSGIGRSVAVLYAREGADVAIVHLAAEETDAKETKAAVEKEGRKCLLIPGDVREKAFCQAAVEKTVKTFGRLDILVNNAAFQVHSSFEDLTEEHFDETLKTNLYGYFFMAQAAVPHLKPGSAIVMTGSITGIDGSKELLDYSMTKGGIHAFVRALSGHLIPKGIRVNAVAPGPVWTPLNPTDKQAEDVAEFGAQSKMKRPAQPEEIAPAYVFLASPQTSSYITGEILPIIGGY